MFFIKKIICHFRKKHILLPVLFYIVFSICKRLNILSKLEKLKNDNIQYSLHCFKCLINESDEKTTSQVFFGHNGLPGYVFSFKLGSKKQILYASQSRNQASSYFIKRIYEKEDIECKSISSFNIKQDVYGHDIHPDKFVYSSFDSKIHLFKIENTCIFNNFICEKNNNILILDAHNDPSDSLAGYSSLIPGIYCPTQRDYLSFHKKSREEDNEKPIHLDDGYLLSSKYSSNFFHFLYEDLIKIKDIDNIFADSAMPIYVPDNLFPQQYEVLSLICDVKNLRLISHKKKYTVSSLFYSQIPSYVSDNIHTKGSDRFRISPDHLLYLREKVMKNISCSDNKFPSRIYLQRKGRSVLNFFFIKKVLQKHKVKIIDPGKMSFFDQFNLFLGAELIIGAAGAGFSNILFCRPGTKIIVLNSERHAENCVFSTIAKILELDYKMLVGPPLYRKGKLMDYLGGNMVSFLSPFFISPKKLNAMLNRVW